MKKLILIFIVSTFFGFLFFISGVEAALTTACPGQSCPEGAICIQNPICAETFEELIEAIINLLFYIAIVATPVLLLIAGLLFVVAGGNPEIINRAKRIILWTIIGFAIVLLSKSFIVIIKVLLGE